MNRVQLSKYLLGVALIVGILIAALAFRPSLSAEKSSRPSVGMGDLQLFEARQAMLDTRAEESSRPYVGMGDLHLYEAQQANPPAGGFANDRPFSGTGDQHLFEAQQGKLYK